MTSIALQEIQRNLWLSTLPLQISLCPAESRTYDSTDPYLIHIPRLSYLPFLLPRLHAFFHSSRIDPSSGSASDGWFSYEGVPLRWHWPVGLLYDLFSGAEGVTAAGGRGGGEEGVGGGGGGNNGGAAERERLLPWRLEVHFEEWPEEQLVRLDEAGRVMHDAFVNGVKEADFLRNGTAKGIMSLSKDDSTKLWGAVQDHDFSTFTSINQKLLDPPGGAKLRHIPLKIYLPSSSSSSSSPSLSLSAPTNVQKGPGLDKPNVADANADTSRGKETTTTTTTTSAAASLRVVQTLITPSLPPRNEPQTLGSALHQLLPSLFPSRRTPTLARPVLHGAVVPLAAPVEEVMRAAAYADGWIHLAIVMMG